MGFKFEVFLHYNDEAAMSSEFNIDIPTERLYKDPYSYILSNLHENISGTKLHDVTIMYGGNNI